MTLMGDANHSPAGCWSYAGMVGPQGGHRGQALNLGGPRCHNMAVYYQELLHALGK